MRHAPLRLASLAVSALLLMVVLPTAEAQVPPPPMPPNYSFYCPDVSFPLYDWLEDCLPDSFTVEPLVNWVGAVDEWLRCQIVGGPACFAS